MYKWLFIGLMSLWLVGCSERSWRTADTSEIQPPLDFSLVDEDGQAVEAEDFLGKVTLVYFGYTYCPDVCPITLARLAGTLNQLDDDVREDIQVLFISVDPERDTPEVVKRYTNAFGPDFIGITGDLEEIDALTNRMRVTYEYEEPNQRGDYIVTHTSAVFAFDREGEAQFLIRDSHPISDAVADINRLVDESE
ncbi:MULTISPECIES: SCO family protein [unclassified Halomonas]|uniref:SCO family protein n=1 Tax=unclassified Halomonas TaxID=2609666 RepID=UPI0006DBA879|nr:MULTISPECIES: SCO family protein [unclassified Halomonas]KPQ31084.1 MAG: protein SCO1/2 [Halomonas sp. HL-93]SBR47546.1 protein SCO1/2 [Halomonas sp. HL-93]SNY99268.1 protein SCO1/2 [Halomonas sp. hl-4]